MPPSPNTTDPNDYDNALDRLLESVRRITAKSLAKERALVKQVTAHHTGTHAEPTETTNTDTPPLEVVRAMRAPAGEQHVVSTYIHGRKVKTVITSLGKRRPDRERAVWKCLVELVESKAV